MGACKKEFRMLESEHAKAPIRVPYVEVTGAADGPTLTVMAGAHGSEYVGITAAMKLAQMTNPEDVRGRLRVVTIANVPGFFGRSMHICPVDGINFAGRFPGDPDGEYSDALASFIYERVGPGSDYVIDVHGGDLEEHLTAYSSWSVTGNEQVDRVSEQMARVVDYPLILKESSRTKPFVRSSLYNACAFLLGVPGILIEAGSHGELEPELVTLQLNAMTNVMKEFGMIDGEPTKYRTPCHLSSFVSVNSPEDGAFYPCVRAGDLIRAGAPLGTLKDLFGAEIDIPVSPVDAVVLGIITTTAMPKGAMIAGLGTLASPFID